LDYKHVIFEQTLETNKLIPSQSFEAVSYIDIDPEQDGSEQMTKKFQEMINDHADDKNNSPKIKQEVSFTYIDFAPYIFQRKLVAILEENYDKN
jgi:hypothetical protein